MEHRQAPKSEHPGPGAPHRQLLLLLSQAKLFWEKKIIFLKLGIDNLESLKSGETKADRRLTAARLKKKFQWTPYSVTCKPKAVIARHSKD